MRPPQKPLSLIHTRSGAATPKGNSASDDSVKGSGIKRKDRDFETEDEDTNINVVVRCRGRNEREVSENSGVVLLTDGVKSNSLELSMGPNALNNKIYHFDKVFSSAADQAMIYDDVVAPILDEMLSGYNCTIFAYGQTGTGKTYTMSGDTNHTFEILSDSAGIIPRALQSLFKKLESNDAEWSVKCSFIELYNEELRDLFSRDDSIKLKIYDDNGHKKGHASTVVQGMEESHIKSAAEGIKLLQSGSLKRQVAATKCNDLSSRSHTVFTVTAYVKRTADNGEDYVSAGKLNLVDLAGSENIQRSGAENKRAAEAGLINKSLLTLGRVINALVDKSSHIPYRESKLTRLLQDSLGGRTKTCIIATVSPAKSNLEETISTLDYAFRAKNIRNIPQVNQMINKKKLLKEFTAEIEKLKSELIATRQRNGVYLSNDSYEEMMLQSESRRILNEEQASKIEMMETNLRNKAQEFFFLTTNFMNLKKDNDGNKVALDEMTTLLEQTEHVLETTRRTLAEESILRKAHQETEKELSNVGHELISTLSQTVQDIEGLHTRDRRRSNLQSQNLKTWNQAQSNITDVTCLVESTIDEFKAHQQELISTMSTRVQNFVSDELGKISASEAFIEEQTKILEGSENNVRETRKSTEEEMNAALNGIMTLHENMKDRANQGLRELSASTKRISAEVFCELDMFRKQLQNSYNSLRNDFNTLYEDLLKHLETQRCEADSLRQKLAEAGELAVMSNLEASSKLETILQEERAQAASDREKLLVQITNLVMAQGESQETRLNSKIGQIKKDVVASKEAYGHSKTTYEKDINALNKQQKQLLEEVSKSRETLSNKIDQGWLATDEKNSHLCDAAKFVHDETLRIVDLQFHDFENQMRALDDFVTETKLKNYQHHYDCEKSFDLLSTTTHSSYSKINSRFNSINECIHHLHENISTNTKLLENSLEPLDSTIKKPLFQLRNTISAMHFQEYETTGETPQKIKYNYPTLLPRTENHELLLKSHCESTQLCGFKKNSGATKPSSSIGERPSSSGQTSSPSIDSPPHNARLSANPSVKLREMDVNVSQVTSFNTVTEEKAFTEPISKMSTCERKSRINSGKLPVMKESRGSIYLDGRENLGDNVTASSTLMISLETRRRRSPRIVS